ncbi:MAG: guanine deaminase [Ruminococcaceae bacterium]|nr:guanine deaminase [Oscillospiraceae bacterium]
MNSFILKGDICYSTNKTTLKTHKDAYAVCVDGVCEGVFDSIAKEYEHLPLYDYSNKLIIPGLSDLHTHAPQYSFRGLNMDSELLSWLNNNAFYEEAKYSDMQYADKAYSIFCDGLKNSVTTRVCIFSTIHTDVTKLLMQKLEESGLVSYVGKVNMDRNSPKNLCEESGEKSASDTEKWIADTKNKFKNTYPIITPRFIPSCSDGLLKNLGEIAHKYDIPVQSHLSENKDEIRWVKELCPESSSYGDAYDYFGLFGKGTKTVMAHCVHCSDEEVELIKKNKVFVAHCPASNTNLSSGIAPIKKYTEKNLRVGLGTDMGGGEKDSLFCAIVEAIKVSKLYYRLIDETVKPLTFNEVFYLATKGGGEFFGAVGSFEKGFEFDAVVIDDSVLPHPQSLTIKKRLERSVYLSADTTGIKAKFVRGNKII